METSRIIESLNSLLPEVERFNIMASGEALDKLCNKCFNVSYVKMILSTYYYAAKDSLKKLLFKEADRLMPWKLVSPEQLVKNKSLVLRHSVTESKYSSSPDGMWQFEGCVSNLETLIRIHTQAADPRTVRGDMLSGVYRAKKGSPWDKIVITDPVFVSSKLYNNGKFDLYKRRQKKRKPVPKMVRYERSPRKFTGKIFRSQELHS
jgi:hypothetical protein